MESAHICHNSLLWNGFKPDASLLLIRRADEVMLLANPTYHAEYGVGAWQMGAESEGEALGIELKRILTAVPIVTAAVRSLAPGTET